MMRYAFDSFNGTFISTIGIISNGLSIATAPAASSCRSGTAGQEQFRSMMYSYYKGAHCSRRHEPRDV